MKPWILSLLLFIVSITITAILWVLGLPFFFFFLFLPLLPFFSHKGVTKRCPVCGWETTGSENFCPFDATPLTGAGGERREVDD
ncbi:MAG: hypothetical protein CVV34_05010 [Methanomicrobiales archaeon HGW-Methanomicrobiales-5]|nr:MAG: hypothetical protein CVV34_05010 [Methanomicrobiales archaeon HGW-Methanomicrobiales-5]